MQEKNRHDTEIIIINQKLENFGEAIKNAEELRNSKKSKAIIVELDTWIEYFKKHGRVDPSKLEENKIRRFKRFGSGGFVEDTVLIDKKMDIAIGKTSIIYGDTRIIANKGQLIIDNTKIRDSYIEINNDHIGKIKDSLIINSDIFVDLNDYKINGDIINEYLMLNPEYPNGFYTSKERKSREG